MSLPKKALRWVLSRRPIALLPVRVKSGLAQGAHWTLFPWTAYWRGTHEPAIQKCLLNLIDWRGKNIWDLGSHYGIFSVGLGLRAGPSGSVAAFEPNPLSFERLQLHLRRNQLTWAKAFPYAVSDRAESQRFFLYQGMETTTSHLAYEGETWNCDIPTMIVQSVRLDDLVAQGQIKSPDFIKLDVEGHGHKALAGAIETIRRSRPIIMAGLHSQAEIDGISLILTTLDYRITPLLANAPSMLSSGYDYLLEPLPH